MLIIFVPCIYCILLAVFLPKQNNFHRVDPKKKKKKKRTWQRMNHMRLKNNRMSLWGFLTSKTGRNQNISAPWTATGLSLTLFIRLCKCVCVCACGLFIEAPRHSFLQCISGIWSVCFYPAPTRWHQSVSISRYNGSSLITALIVEEHQ